MEENDIPVKTQLRKFLCLAITFRYVLMAEDMVFAVPQPAALRAVAELHGRVRKVRNAADSAAVERFFLSRDRPRLFAHLSFAGLDLPQDVPAEEQEEVADGCEHEQARYPRSREELPTVADPEEKRNPFYLHR